MNRHNSREGVHRSSRLKAASKFATSLAILALTVATSWSVAAQIVAEDPRLLNSTGNLDLYGDSIYGLAADGRGNLVAVWNTGTDENRDFDIYVATSQDNGASWSEVRLLNTDGLSDTEPRFLQLEM